MFSSFDKAFPKNNQIFKIPKEIVDHLNNTLPPGFEYVSLEDGGMRVTPTTSEIDVEVNLKVPEGLNFNSDAEVLEYLYRTQQEIELQGEFIKINNQKFKISDLISYPLQNKELTYSSFILKPQEFPPPFKMLMEADKVKKELTIQRKPYADMKKMLFESEKEKFFSLSYIFDEENNNAEFIFNISFDCAQTTKEVLEGLILFKACQNGNIKMFDTQLSDKPINKKIEGLEDSISFWRKIIEIEKKLKVIFRPKFPISEEDTIWIERLYRSLIEEKPYKEYYHISKLTTVFNEDIDIKEILKDKKKLTFIYTETLKLILFDAELNLYNVRGIFGFEILDILEKEHKKNEVEILIKPLNEKGIYQANKIFLTENETNEFSNNVSALANAESIEY